MQEASDKVLSGLEACAKSQKPTNERPPGRSFVGSGVHGLQWLALKMAWLSHFTSLFLPRGLQAGLQKEKTAAYWMISGGLFS